MTTFGRVSTAGPSPSGRRLRHICIDVRTHQAAGRDQQRDAERPLEEDVDGHVGRDLRDQPGARRTRAAPTRGTARRPASGSPSRAAGGRTRRRAS